jgi:tetratricopeptide (TPR) repeat protein
MIIAEQFFKSIPLQDKDKILSKLDKFEKQLLDGENIIRELPAGYWVRNIKNTNIFKFRLNNKDRILFSFIPSRKCNENYNSDVLFLKYVTHDEQIRVGTNLNINVNKIINIEIDDSKYVDDEKIENVIEEEVTNQFPNGIVDMSLIPSVVAKDEDLKVIADESNTDYLYYLSNEQYAVLESLEYPVLLYGAGGTGKTVVLANVLALAKESNEKFIYLSYNPLLVQSTKSIYDKFIGFKEDNYECEFSTIQELQNKISNAENERVITNNKMIAWLEKNVVNFKELKYRDIYEVVSEIKGIIKGYLGLEYSEVIELKENNKAKITLETYLKMPKQYSNFNEEEKISMYRLSELYDDWLKKNNYLDESDVARKSILKNKHNETYKWVIVDEIQDLSEVQIYMISQLVEDGGHIIWAGDINQTINTTFFNYGRIKNLYYTNGKKIKDFTLKKNYRTSKENIKFINEVIDSRVKLIGKSTYDYYEEGFREGSKPSILKYNEKEIRKLIEDIEDKHYCAIIVANENEKKDLIKKYPEVESRIFVVYEIKGLEYENIFCYNILSVYEKIWNSILEGKYKHNDKMRYYFNLLYVAISRAKNSLYIIENKLENIDFKPFNSCSILDIYNNEMLNLVKESTKEDWKKEAERLEVIGQSERAALIRDRKLEEKLKAANTNVDKIAKEIFNDVSEEVIIDEKIDEELKPGIIEYRRRNYTGALEIFNKLLEKYPNEAKIYYYAANTYCYMAGGMDYSINFFEKAIELDPNQYEYYLDMAAVLRASHKFEKSIEVLSRAKELFPDFGNADEIKATVYQDMGKIQKAINCFKCSKNYPKYSFDSYNKVWTKPQNELRKENKPQNEKLKIIKDVKDIDLSNMKKMPKGIEYLSNFNNEQLQECIKGIPYKSITSNKKKKRFSIEFDIETCKKCEDYNNCISSTADDQNKISLNHSIVKDLKKKLLEQATKNKKSQSLNEFSSKMDVMNAYLKKSNKAVKYAQLGNYYKAIDLYNSIINDSLESYLKSLRKLNSEKSSDIFQKSLGEEFTSLDELEGFIVAELYNNLGRCYMENRQYSKAKESLLKAINLSPTKYLNSYLSLGDVYMSERNYNEAKYYYSKAVELGEPRGYIGISRANEHINNY